MDALNHYGQWPILPRIYKGEFGFVCFGGKPATSAVGTTPKEAYDKWQLKAKNKVS